MFFINYIKLIYCSALLFNVFKNRCFLNKYIIDISRIGSVKPSCIKQCIIGNQFPMFYYSLYSIQRTTELQEVKTLFISLLQSKDQPYYNIQTVLRGKFRFLDILGFLIAIFNTAASSSMIDVVNESVNQGKYY